MADDTPTPPVSENASPSPETRTDTPPTTPPSTTAETKTIDDLKIVHESPEKSPKQKEQAPDAPMTREELLEQATKFLESAPIKNAPLKEKLEFLYTKGLTREETEALLAKLEENVSGTPPKTEDKGKGKELVKAESSTSTAIAQSKETPPAPKPAPIQQAPILTYPEFLTPAPPPPPPPLLTAKSLGKALYFASGAAATIYGANKFVFTPMYDALTAARLELSSTALTNLTEFNTRLRALVPETKPRSTRTDDDNDSDTSSTSDPGEMFHVDAQTQTSPSLEAFQLDGDDIMALSPESKLEHLGRQLETLVESHSDGTDNELTFALEDLTTYLETLTYEFPGMMGMYSSPYGGYGNTGAVKEKDKDDPIAKVKAEIRSVKGVLLNSKNFPTTR